MLMLTSAAISKAHCIIVQVWTHGGRVAFVLSVSERGRPVSLHKLEAFRGRLMAIMDSNGAGIVRTRTVIAHACLILNGRKVLAGVILQKGRELDTMRRLR